MCQVNTELDGTFIEETTMGEPRNMEESKKQSMQWPMHDMKMLRSHSSQLPRNITEISDLADQIIYANANLKRMSYGVGSQNI